MPVYELIDGVKICVYSNDHVPPHVHAIYGEHKAVLVIADGSVIEGYLPKSQLKKVQAIIAAESVDLFDLFYQLNPKIEKL